jgi:hypothetical protein
MVDLGLTPSVKSKQKNLQGLDVVPVESDKLLKEGDEWSKRYEKIVEQGQEVKTDE